MKSYSIILSALLAAACTDSGAFETKYLASDVNEATVYNFNDSSQLCPSGKFTRGTVVKMSKAPSKRINDRKYREINLNDNEYWVPEETLVDSLNQVVLETERWALIPASIISDSLTSRICGQTVKGQKLEVTGYSGFKADGSVYRYKVRSGEESGWVYAKYLVPGETEAVEPFREAHYKAIHSKVRNIFGGGRPEGCDFRPVQKPRFADNVMPDECRSLYLNISPAGIGRIDQFIELAKTTRINTFVIDIKDNECPGYKAEAMAKYSPTNFARAGKEKEAMYANAVRRLHEEGFYVVGRITCFKDSYFVKDNPGTAITDKATGEPFFHNKAFWPSAYDRRVWQFNVELAKEAVRKFGFNEINFDYVRFPDRMNSVEDKIDYHNRYGESKVQAIQRFVQYACDEIHAAGAYVSIDVFGESANGGYTTAYGQYWPALSNIADVMSGMPYPDHFANNAYGIQKPWNHPYELLHAWGTRVQERQAECETPAKVRTWIQAYHVMSWVDKNGIDYNAENIPKEIRGLYDAGLTGGYITWLSSSSYNRYCELAPAFRIDYLNQ